MHNLWTVLVLALVLLFCGPLIETLPHAALAAIVAVSFKSLLLNGFEEMRKCWRVSVADFAVWSVAFWSALLTNVTVGIAVAVGADVLFLFYTSTMPSYSVLGRLRGTGRLYRSRCHFEEAKAIRGVMIFRFDESLHFANREVFATKLWQELRAHDAELNGTPLRGSLSFWTTLRSLRGTLMSRRSTPEDDGGAPKKVVTAVVVDFSPISHIDMSGICALEKLRAGLAARGTRLILAHCKYACYQKLSGMGFFGGFEPTGRFDVVCFRELHDAVLFAEGRLPVPACNEDADGVVRPPADAPVAPGSTPPCAARAFSGTPSGLLTEAEGALPQCHGRSFLRRKATEDWLQERGVAVGHEERGHHEPLQEERALGRNASLPVGGQAGLRLPTLLTQRPAHGGAAVGDDDLEVGRKLRRSSSEGNVARQVHTS